MKAILFFAISIVLFATTSCTIVTSDKSDSMPEQELREVAHAFCCVTINEFMNYEHDFVYEEELPSMILFDKTILKDVCKADELNLDLSKWTGINVLDDFNYYAVFNCCCGKDVFYAYLGVDLEMANDLLRYIASPNEMSYFPFPFVGIIDMVYHKEGMLNRQFIVKGKLSYILSE